MHHSHQNDSYGAYETGVAALFARLGAAHPRYNEALVYEQRRAAR